MRKELKTVTHPKPQFIVCLQYHFNRIGMFWRSSKPIWYSYVGFEPLPSIDHSVSTANCAVKLYELAPKSFNLKERLECK